MKKNVKSGKTGSALARSAEYEIIKRRARLSPEEFINCFTCRDISSAYRPG